MKILILALKTILIMAILPVKLWYFRRKYGDKSLAEYRRAEYIIDQFKPVLLEALVIADGLIPNLTKENIIRYQDTHNLISIRDEYLSHELLESSAEKHAYPTGRFEATRVIFNFAIILCENNRCYKNRLRYLISQVSHYEWEPQRPITNWR